MLCHNQLKPLLGLTLLGLIVSIPVNAQELQLWKVAKQVPTFYQEASESSEKLTKLKPEQAMIILVEKKDWIQLFNIETKQVGWIKHMKIDPRLIINLTLNQAPHAYSYHIKMQSPDGTQMSEGHITRTSFNSYDSTRVKNLGKQLSAKILGKDRVKELKNMGEMVDDMIEKFAFPLPIIQSMVIVSSPNTNEATKEMTKEVAKVKEKVSVPNEKTELIEPIKVSNHSNQQEG